MLKGPTGGDLTDEDVRVLESIQRRALWLAVRMVDHANRRDDDDIKVGGHQASSASLATVMTALYLEHLQADDLVSVKPHASPMYHAVRYLLGDLERRHLTELRAFGGLQAYPSRTKDPDPVDFSTGSVGLGAAAPLFAAAAHRYLQAHGSSGSERRFVALVGDAELDEGNVWEAVADPVTAGLGNVLWIVDCNRQSLDRVVPGVRVPQLETMFEANGWQVLEVKYGRRLQALFEARDGQALREHIDRMPNERYQWLFGCPESDLRDGFLVGAGAAVERAVADLSEAELRATIQDLGGHDLRELLAAFAEADRATDRPTVIFAYTVKGWGLPIAGDPRNHSALLDDEQIAALRERSGLREDDEWDRFPADSVEAARCAAAGDRLRHRGDEMPNRPPASLPVELGIGGSSMVSTQATLGRLLVRLSREEVGDRVVTCAPDVATSTNLAGWLGKVGVFTADAPDGSERDRDIWHGSPTGQHIELGISEMNLFLLLGQLGLTADLFGERLFPIGTLYDPFICRGLDALIYALYSDARFVVVGTPSGVTLSYEGGAHQSAITPSIGTELPGLTYVEPTYAGALDWWLCRALERIDHPEGGSTYLRLTTRPIDQDSFDRARERVGPEELRRQVLSGGYVLQEVEPGAARSSPVVNLFACGPVMPEVLEAASILRGEGVAPRVIDVTSPDLLHRQRDAANREALRTARRRGDGFHLGALVPHPLRRAPIVTIHDAASHTLGWIGSTWGAPSIALGVDAFGQSGRIRDLYGYFDLLPDAIANAALVALDLDG